MILSMDSLSLVNGVVQDASISCIISKELVDSTFRNQKIILESKKKQKRNFEILEEMEFTKNKIEILEQEEKEMAMFINEKKRKIKMIKAGMVTIRLKMSELDQLAFSLTEYIMNRRAIPSKIILRCEEEIKAASNVSDLTDFK